MNNFETSKSRLVKMASNKVEQGYSENIEGEAIRQLNIVLQKCKMQILNKFKGPASDKQAIVEEFKKLQTAIEKIKRK